MALNAKDFHYHFAVDHSGFSRFGHLMTGSDILVSFVYLTKKADPTGKFLDKVKKHKGRIMIDSGGFTNFTTPGTIKFEEWLDFMKSNKGWVDEYVQFDDLTSRAKTLDYYDKARKAGLDPMAVDHLWFRTQMDRMNKIWKNKDKVALSGFAKTLPGQKPFPGDAAKRVHEAFTKGRDNKTMVHLLAAGSMRRFFPYFDVVHSADSAGWDKSAAFGKVLIFDWDDRGGGLKLPILKIYSYPENARNNDRPLERGCKGPDWDVPLRAMKVPHWAVTQRAKAVSIFHIKRYVKELLKLNPHTVRQRLEQRAKEKTIGKAVSYFFLEDDWDLDDLGEQIEKKKPATDIDPKEVMGYIERAGDFVVVPHYVSLVGSVVTGEEDQPVEDVDLVVRAAEEDPKVSIKLDRLFPPDLRSKVHLILDATGPNWAHIPIYDLVLRRRRELVKVDVDEPDFNPYPSTMPEPVEKAAIRLLRAFTPLKARGGYHQGEFFEVDPLLQIWAGPSFKDGRSISVEPKFDGIRFTVHKDGDRVAIFTEDEKRDRADILLDVVAEVKKLSVDKLILDGELVWWKGGKPLPRHEMMNLVVGKDPIEGEDLRFNAFDALWFAGEGSLVDLPWEERQAFLRKALPQDGKHLKRVVPRVVSNERELRAALRWARGVLGSEGAMLKLTDAPYDLSGMTGTWAKLKDVLELKCLVIGVRKKMPTDEEDPSFKKTPARWTFEGIKDPSAYTYRCAVMGPGGRLVPIEGERTYTESDLNVRFVEKGDKDPVTGQVASQSEWRGVDDPKLWKMGRGFSDRKLGDYEYGVTYNTALKADIGEVIAVSPVLIREWTGKDGKQHYSWTFPIVREQDPTREKPDTVQDLRRVAQASDSRNSSPEPTEKAADLVAARPSLTGLVQLQKQRRGDLDQDETDLTREQSRELIEDIEGDPYMVEQKGTRKYKFVLQHHYRGFWSEDERRLLRQGLRRVRNAVKQGKEADARRLLAGLWSDFKPMRIRKPIDDIRAAAQRADDAGEGEVSPTVRRLLDPGQPRLVDLDGVEDDLVNLGNVHGDLRMESPMGRWLVGWTLDSPKLALQTLDGKAHNLLRSEIVDNEENDNIVAQRKLVQPRNWLTIVSGEKPIYRTKPGDIGSTKGTAGEYHYVASGDVIFGVQKSDFHEYFLFPKDGDWGGRWGIQLIEGKPDYKRTPAEFWMANRPAKTQTPYIQTHDREKEEAKAKADKIELIWNDDAIKALKAAKYPDLAEDVAKASGKPMSRFVPIVKVATEQRYVMGVVMIPDDVDAHDEVASEEDIRKAAHNFLVNGPKIGYQHQETPGGLTLLESYLAPADFTLDKKKIKKGTWLMAVRVNNDKVWKAIKDGKITGFSIEGYAKKVPLKKDGTVDA